MQDDWLDAQLARVEVYRPDDGFTAQVLGRLPKADSSAVRSRILAISGVSAFALFVLHVMTYLQGRELAGYFRRIPQIQFHGGVCEILGSALGQPTILLSLCGVVGLMSLGAIPLVRRLI